MLFHLRADEPKSEVRLTIGVWVRDEIVPIFTRFLEVSINCVPFNCSTVEAPAKLTILPEAFKKVLAIVPILVKLREESTI